MRGFVCRVHAGRKASSAHRAPRPPSCCSQRPRVQNTLGWAGAWMVLHVEGEALRGRAVLRPLPSLQAPSLRDKPGTDARVSCGEQSPPSDSQGPGQGTGFRPRGQERGPSFSPPLLSGPFHPARLQSAQPAPTQEPRDCGRGGGRWSPTGNPCRQSGGGRSGELVSTQPAAGTRKSQPRVMGGGEGGGCWRWRCGPWQRPLPAWAAWAPPLSTHCLTFKAGGPGWGSRRGYARGARQAAGPGRPGSLGAGVTARRP